MGQPGAAWNQASAIETSSRCSRAVAQPQLLMKTPNLSAALLGATAALAAGIYQPTQAQMYGYGYPRPVQRQPLMIPSQSGAIYQPQRPVMQQPAFSQPRQLPSQRGFGHSSGSYFGY